MKEIKVGKDRRILLDDEDYVWLSRLTWKMHKGGYAQLSKFNLLHRIVTNAPSGMDVHHINGDKLDNRKENLLVISPQDHQKYHFHRIVAFQKSRQRYADRKKCVVCGGEFPVNPRKRKRHKCCSPKCAMSMRIAGRRRQVASSHK